MHICTLPQTDNHARIPPLSFFTGWMPFLPPNQQCQRTEGNQLTIMPDVRETCCLFRLWHWTSKPVTIHWCLTTGFLRTTEHVATFWSQNSWGHRRPISLRMDHIPANGHRYWQSASSVGISCRRNSEIPRETLLILMSGWVLSFRGN